MNDRVPSDDPLPTRTEVGEETVDLPEGLGFFSTGQVLGERYEILEMLGRGGMGEVWRAFDLKLRVEVGLKALREELFQSERRLEVLRQEVRAAREVVSPNVCRIFDLIEINGRELVSMEYVDGATLLGVLQERGPLELKEAQDIASQFLSGLEAIHKAGLVHRDVKPENIMLTRAGRVVVMDFGLARGPESGAGSVSGTPAYMAPEHAAGQDVDARADVYSAGVVLAEMVSPEGIKSYESRQSLWEGMRSEPAQVPESPWAPVIQRAVARDRARRPNSAHTLIRELEDVTLRVEGAEDLHPYPGLASFTEQDAEYFFGREAEVEQMWRTLEGPPRMLGLVGPSGAGKSSFIRAGLFAAAPAGWSFAVCTPGEAVISSLGRVMAREMAGDPAVTERMVDFDNPDVAIEVISRWCGGNRRAVLVIDQFEELFTQNTATERERFAALLHRVVVEADVCVILSLRDDFLMRCRDVEVLRSIFADLTALPSLTGSALRRALVQPATTCGYRFENDELVDEMLDEVEDERGALPMLAFAAARLWEMRDRETGQLTRQAYRDIGGVGGALARHAEVTVDRIGIERVPVIREVFRNLVTPEGTRAVREWDELLSVFNGGGGEGIKPSPTNNADRHHVKTGITPAREAAEEVLRELIDARLLTSYEVRHENREPTRRVEIIHESLLANWPRLVGWQTQDADSARLRHELRQAARTWNEHDRSRDFLWTGTAYREFALWHERYPGGLSELEEGFANAMTRQASRLKLRRRMAVTAAFALLLVVLAIVGISRQQAVAEARRAEASKLVTLGRTFLESDRTQALAHAIASLELSDIFEARRLALRALWAGPPVTVLAGGVDAWALAFSPDGLYLVAGCGDGTLRIYPRDGGDPVTVPAFSPGWFWSLEFSRDGRYLVGGSFGGEGEVKVWETEGWQLKRTLTPPEPPKLDPALPGFTASYGVVEPSLESVLTMTLADADERGSTNARDPARWVVRRWPLVGGSSELVGVIEGDGNSLMATPDPTGTFVVAGVGDELHVHRLRSLGREKPIVLPLGDAFVSWFGMSIDPAGERVAVCNDAGVVQVWPLADPPSRPERRIVNPDGFARHIWAEFSPDGGWFLQASRQAGAWLWDLRGPALGEPISLSSKGSELNQVVFSPDGRWLAASGSGELSLWPVPNDFPRFLRDVNVPMYSGQFSPDGAQLMFSSMGQDGFSTVQSWPLAGGAGLEPEVPYRGSDIWDVVLDPRGRFVIVGDMVGLHKIPFGGGEPTSIEGTFVSGLYLDLTGRYLTSRAGSIVAVQDLETGDRMEIEPPGEGDIGPTQWDVAGGLLLLRGGVISRWHPEIGETEVLVSGGAMAFRPMSDADHIVVRTAGPDGEHELWEHDLTDGTRKRFPEAFQDSCTNHWSADSSILVSGHHDGDVRVSSRSDDEPHLRVGHVIGHTFVRVSPDGNWVFSSGNDGAVILWPMPDVSRRPFHTLPHDEFVARLKALTNVRVMPDPKSDTGYAVRLDPDAFRGWAEVPEWW